MRQLQCTESYLLFFLHLTGTLPPTLAPTVVTLAPYALLYSLETFGLPLQTDVDALTDLTEAFLDDYFRVVFDTSGLTQFEGSVTIEDETIVRFGQPVQVRYLTDLTFGSTSQIPKIVELNDLLESAFRGDNLASYLAEVQGLPPSNIFESASSIEFMKLAGAASTGTASGAAMGGIAAAAGAAALFAILGGVMLYRRRDTDENEGKHLDLDDGHITVAGDTCAGDTFAGETYAGDSQSGVHRTSQFGEEESVSPGEWGDYQDADTSSSQDMDEEHALGPSPLGANLEVETSDESDGDSQHGSQQLEEVAL